MKTYRYRIRYKETPESEIKIHEFEVKDDEEAIQYAKDNFGVNDEYSLFYLQPAKTRVWDLILLYNKRGKDETCYLQKQMPMSTGDKVLVAIVIIVIGLIAWPFLRLLLGWVCTILYLFGQAAGCIFNGVGELFKAAY